MNLFGRVMVWAALVLLPSTVWSQDLSTERVQGFVGVMEEFKPFFERYAEDADDDGDAASTAKLVTDWAHEFKCSSDMLTVLEKHGFDKDSWPVVAAQVSQAYMAVKFGEHGQDALGQMRRAVMEIEGNRDISAEDKAQMLAQMKENMAVMEKTLSAPAADQDAVREFIPQLDAVFGWSD